MVGIPDNPVVSDHLLYPRFRQGYKPPYMGGSTCGYAECPNLRNP